MQRYCTIRTHYPPGQRPGPQAIRVSMALPAEPAQLTPPTGVAAVLATLLWAAVLHGATGLGWVPALVIAALGVALASTARPAQPLEDR